jgi:phage baseplate assembly protein W
MAASNLTLAKEEVYSDFNTSFAIHPIRHDMTRLTNEDAVKRSIKNILLTNRYERRFRPDFGSGLSRYLFEPLTPITLSLMKKEIEQTISTYEPRATILDVVVSAATDQNSVEVSITFSLINSLIPVVLTTTISALERAR